METVESSPASPAPSEEEPPGKSFFEKIKSALGFRGAPDTTAELEHEIQELLEEGEEQGLISVHEERLINSIFDFRETIASEIMTPSAEMVCADLKTSVPELIRLINEEGYTRIPIYQGTPDQIIGILHAKDLLRICARGTDTPVDLKDYLNPATVIPESKPITELLREFQTKKIHLAIVVDEFGGVRGLVTFEDVIEEIVGEIDDEHDPARRGPSVRRWAGAHLLSGRLHPDEVREACGFEMPEGEFETLAGFVMSRLGAIPEVGDVVDSHGWSIEVVSMDGRRVATLRLVAPAPGTFGGAQ
jgi:CBS domain containing-hemolysin-like protein